MDYRIEKKEAFRIVGISMQRQMIVEHPFGTVKRAWGYNYFLTRGLESVNVENQLHLLAYNLRRVINILGVEEIVRRLAPA